VSGFKAFMLQTNALALAIGVIIGLAANNVVTSLVDDIIMPPIGYALGNVDFSQMKIILKDTGDTTTEVAIRYGAFISVLISFVVIALVVYLISKLFLRPAPTAPTKACQYCKETVPADATKCRACASSI
jgi:large conductance mechanosensitive channel